MRDMERILDVSNYFDSVIVTDEKGVILYYANGRADIYWPTEEEIDSVGRGAASWETRKP